MTSAEPGTAGFVAFGTARVDRPETGRALAELLAGEMRDEARLAHGFFSSRIHLSLDGTAVVNRGEWLSEAARDAHTSQDNGLLGSLPGRRGVVSTTIFSGARAACVEGPAVGERTGFAAVATRHVSGHEAAGAVVDLLVRTGEWKRHSAGFISATAYVGPDGRTFVNYPRWVDEDAYRHYVADPRIAVAQDAIARLEIASPEYLLCRVTADIETPSLSGRKR
jgi:quinol monooxygenase YgiN